MLKSLMRDKRTKRRSCWIGLSFRELLLLRGAPGESVLQIDGKELGLPFDIVLYSGEDEQAMIGMMQNGITEKTDIQTDLTVKN